MISRGRHRGHLVVGRGPSSARDMSNHLFAAVLSRPRCFACVSSISKNNFTRNTNFWVRGNKCPYEISIMCGKTKIYTKIHTKICITKNSDTRLILIFDFFSNPFMTVREWPIFSWMRGVDSFAVKKSQYTLWPRHKTSQNQSWPRILINIGHSLWWTKLKIYFHVILFW